VRRKRFDYDRIMKDGPNIARIASLIGDHARCDMLTALLAGEALTATELAAEAGITKQTASSHLAKLVDAGLVVVETQGRHRYFRLAAADVAQLLETLMGVAQRTGATRVRPGPREPALRKARVCYDHLAGDIGVETYDALLARRFIRSVRAKGDGGTLIELTNSGKQFFAGLNFDLAGTSRSRRPLCRPCLDWSVRRHHLAGSLGAAVLQHCYQQRWAKRVEGSRIVQFTAGGEQALRDTLGL
jgi:DNA-binding transcriptional ArsR family regulator